MNAACIISPSTAPETAAGYASALAGHGLNGTKPRRALPELVSGAWISDHQPQLPDEVVHNLLHRGCKMVIGGGSKSFKTWCLADLAISISTGTDWLGLGTAPGVVAYMNLELMPGFFYDRLLRIAKAKGVELPDELKIWNLRGFAESAHLLLPEIAHRLKGLDVAAIFVDPIYKLALGTDENSANETANLLNELEKLAEDTNAAVIFGAHFSKGNQAAKEAMDRISGSGVYARDPDVILTMTRHTEEGAFTIDATLRNCPPLAPFAVRWDFPLMRLAPDLDPAELKQAKVGTAKRTFSIDDVVGVLPLGVAHAMGAWRDLARDEAGIGRSRFYELAKEIKTHGHHKITNEDEKFTRIL